MIVVRLALAHEKDRFVELVRAAHAESYPELVFSETRCLDTFQRYLNTAHPTFFFADQGGDVIGILQAGISAFDYVDALFTTLHSVYVRPDKRGTRAAVKLIAEFCRWSDRNIGALESTGGNDNRLHTERTTRFLALFGFETVGTFVTRKRGAGRGQKEQ